MTTRDYTILRDELEQLVGTDLTPHQDGGGPASILNLLANKGVWESFAAATSADTSRNDRYATVLLGLAIDAHEYLGELPTELRDVADLAFRLLGTVERIHGELYEENVSYASVQQLEEAAAALPTIVDTFKQAAVDAYRDNTWNGGIFRRTPA